MKLSVKLPPGLDRLRRALAEAGYEFTPAEILALEHAVGLPMLFGPGRCQCCDLISAFTFRGSRTGGLSLCPDCLVARRMERPLP